MRSPLSLLCLYLASSAILCSAAFPEEELFSVAEPVSFYSAAHHDVKSMGGMFSGAAFTDQRVGHSNMRPMAVGDIVIEAYNTQDCTDTATATQSITPNTCVASTIKSAGGAQDVNYLQGWVDASGLVTLFGYTDAACTNVVRTQAQSSGTCRFSGTKFVATGSFPSAGTAPPTPTIAQGFAVGSQCDTKTCNTGCVTSAFKMGGCSTFLNGQTGELAHSLLTLGLVKRLSLNSAPKILDWLFRLTLMWLARSRVTP
jgi:hypothetical protein